MVSNTSLGNTLPVDLAAIEEEEVEAAARKLKWGKACGHDDLPTEFCKAICVKGTAANRWATELCKKCWADGCIPEAWHKARVAAIFKKGDVADCGNYRPISLLPIGYKLLANILLKRLKDAGAEGRVWHTQFGFCSKRSTFDAVFLARRIIENAVALKDRKLVLLALDWAKAFDSISPEGLLKALDRFGVPEKLLKVVGAIYTDRCFYVSDAGTESASRPQHFGICQGCPLSPFLFGMLMTVLIKDAKQMLEQSGVKLSTEVAVNEILYADDTLLIDVDAQVVEQYMQCVAAAGNNYGLAFNWKKLEILPINCVCLIPTPAGNHVKQKESMTYLGSLLCASGSSGSELSRRLGEARGSFDKLRRVWGHANIRKERKLQIYQACVVSKLLCNLPSLWLNVAKQRKMDAFHTKCLRRVLKIPPSFYSGVSNQIVLQQSSSRLLSKIVLERQLLFMGALAVRSDSDVLRSSVFEVGTLEPRRPQGPKKRGRPRMLWSCATHKHAVEAAGSLAQLANLWQDNPAARTAWISKVKEHCRV